MKSTSNALKDLSEAKTSESSQDICEDPEFEILDYLPCECKFPIKTRTFLALKFYMLTDFQNFAAHFTTSVELNIGEKILAFLLLILKKGILRGELNHIKGIKRQGVYALSLVAHDCTKTEFAKR